MKIFRPLKKAGIIKKYAVVDTETWGLGGKMAFGVVYISDKSWYKFKTCEQFYSIVKREKIKLIYAHNLDFDYVKITNTSSLVDTSSVIYAGGLLITLTDKTGLQWRDSLALLKSTVDNLGKALGLKKGVTPEKFCNPPKDLNYRTVNEKDIKYCVRDCKIVKIMLERLFNLTECQKMTIASTCMFYFRRKYLKEPIYIHDSHKLFQKSYYGGRVEAFKLGKTKAKVVDVNSMYPSVMKGLKIPHPNHIKQVYPDLNTGKLLINQFEGVAHVTVKHPYQKIGMLPVRHDGKLIFPTGVFSGWYNFNELRFFMRNKGIIKEIKEFHYATKNLEGFFDDYVTDNYKLKNDSEGAEKLLYKFILNTLYGKFGERNHSKRIYFKKGEFESKIEPEIKNRPFKLVELKRGFSYCEISGELDKEPLHTCFNICSYITSASRLVLLKALLENKNKVVYCDTDSMAIEGKYKGHIGSKLGQWSYEDYEVIKVYGNKFYRTNKGLKLKGVPKRAEIKGKKFYFEALIKSKESMRSEHKVGTTIIKTKSISLKYDKRTQNKNNRGSKAIIFKSQN